MVRECRRRVGVPDQGAGRSGRIPRRHDARTDQGHPPAAKAGGRRVAAGGGAGGGGEVSARPPSAAGPQRTPKSEENPPPWGLLPATAPNRKTTLPRPQTAPAPLER